MAEPQQYVRVLLSFLALFVTADNLPAAPPAPQTVRLHFVWSGEQPRLWIGEVRVDKGRFSKLKVLGLDADQPGSYVNQDNRIRIWPRYAAKSSGFEISITTADLESVVELDLATESGERDTQVRFAVREILQGSIEREMGDGYRLRIRRPSSDLIRVNLPGDHVVFAPGQSIPIEVGAFYTSAKPSSAMRARFRIRSIEDGIDVRRDVTDLLQFDDGLWTRTETVRADQRGSVDSFPSVTIPIPDREGCYELEIDLSYRFPLVGSVAKRRLQFVVVDPLRPPLFGAGKSELVTEFNPADPSWIEYLSQLQNRSNLISGRKKGPWSNRATTVKRQGETDWTVLAGDGWVAYLLSGIKPNTPHVLEVEFPTNAIQDVGVSIFEPKSSGSLAHQIGTAGLTQGDQDLLLPQASDRSEPTKHRVVFWPQAASPVVVISNRSQQQSAMFGRIRLEAYPQGLPVKQVRKGKRRRIAMLRGELLRTMFHAEEVPVEGRRPDAWSSYLLASRRLIAYLRYCGYDGATINVARAGSSLYPSQYLAPTPAFDQSVLQSEQPDPYRKDVLELLFQLFDREGLTLIPSVEFATPLPGIEAQLANSEVSVAGIELFDVQQNPGWESQLDDDGLAPFYNPLNGSVQKAMQDVLAEISQRYQKHPSFAGIHLNLQPRGYSQLPGKAWAFDESTLSEFLKEYPQAGPETIRTLAFELQADQRSDLVNEWLHWRAQRLAKFYGQVATSLQQKNQHLFLSLMELFDSEPWQKQLRPALPRQATVEQVLLELGLDLTALQQHAGVTVLRPIQIASLDHLGAQAVNLEANETDIQQSFRSTSRNAVQLNFETREQQLTGFDRQGPARRTEHKFLATWQLAGSEARRHLALSLAKHDDAWIFEGGQMLPFGQEHSTESFFQVFRELPEVSFQRLNLPQSGPIVSWVAVDRGTTYAYFVNTSPWSAKAHIQWHSLPNVLVQMLGRTAEPVKASKELEHYAYDVAVKPYGVFAFRFASDEVRLVDCQTELPPEIEQQLRVQLDEIRSREKRIEIREEVALLNNLGFEHRDSDGNVEDWLVSASPGSSVHSLKDEKDNHFLRLVSQSSVSVSSRDFAGPETGRLVILLKLRKPRFDQATLVLQLEALSSNYRPHHQFVEISPDSFEDHGLLFVDLPTDPDLRLRLNLRLRGEGEVWVDDIRLYDRHFYEEEKRDLKKIIYRAYSHFDNGDFADCYQTLSGYWPRFLLRHVPPPPRVAAVPNDASQPLQPAETARRFDLRRLMRLRK